MSDVPSLYNILLQCASIPCSSGLTAFLSLVTSENQRLQLALDVLLPALQDQNVQSPQKILAAYVLHALYDSRNDLNPFHNHLLRVFQLERTAAVNHLRTFQPHGSPGALRPRQGILPPENEQLVWVLWKILKGEAEDFAPYSPNILSRIVLPQHLRASHLVLPIAQTADTPPAASGRHPSKISPLIHQFASTSLQSHPPHLDQKISLSPTMSSPTDSFTQSTRTTFSPFTSPFDPESSHGISTSARTDRWGRKMSPTDSHQDRYQIQPESPPSLDTRSMRSKSHSTPIDSVQSSITISDDHRREALLHALCEEPPPETIFGSFDRTVHPWNADTGSNGYSKGRLDQRARDLGADVIYGDLNHGMRVSPTQKQPAEYFQTFPRATSSRTPLATQNPESTSLKRQLDVSASSFANAIAYTNAASAPQLGPIARPKAAPLPAHNSSEVSPVSPHGSDSRHVPAETLSRATRASPLSGPLPQTQGTAQNSFFQKIQAPNPSASLNPAGVIGSGRPSSKTRSPVNSDASERGRPPNFGAIGNGRPSRRSPGATTSVIGEDGAGMIPFSMEPLEQRKGEEGWRQFGAIERPKNSTRAGGELVTEEVSQELRPQQAQRVRGLTSPHPPAQSPVRESSLIGDPQQPIILAPASEVAPPQPLSEPSVLRADNTSSPTPPSPDTQNSALSSSQDHLSIPQSELPDLAATSSQSRKQSENKQMSSIRAPSKSVDLHPEVDEKERDELSRAIILLLSARERVLTLSEQRFLIPHLPLLTCPLSLLRPGDLHPLVAKNPDVAAKLLVLVLDRDDDDGARIEGVLRDVGENDFFLLESMQGSFDTTLPASIGLIDAIQNCLNLVNSAGSLSSDTTGLDKVSPFGGREAREGYLEALRRLPPTMQSFNLIAKLLRPTQGPVVGSSNNQDSSETRVAKLVRTDVLGGLVSSCVGWIEKAEEMEREGEVPDDRVAVSVSSLSRFYFSLLKHGFVSAESEADTTEIMSFALQFSRFEEARSLYSMLATARV